jgi:hypothetical protein
MKQLDRYSLLRLARCSRALFRCASHPFVWKLAAVLVKVRGSELIEDPRRSRSLLRFAPRVAYVGTSAMNPSAAAVSRATLLRVPHLVALNFDRTSHPLVQLNEWHSFLQHPSTQRLEGVNISAQPALCDATSLTLLGQLPLLTALRLFVPAAASASHLAPLVRCPALTDIGLFGPMDDSATIPTPLEPLRRCTRLHTLTLSYLHMRVGQLSTLLIQLAQAGGRLQVLRLVYMRMLPMDGSMIDAAAAPACDALDFDLVLAAPYLPHLRDLVLHGASSALDCMLGLPSLRMLELSLDLLPSAIKLELLLHCLPHLRCTFRYSPVDHPQNAAMLPQVIQLAQQHPRLLIRDD